MDEIASGQLNQNNFIIICQIIKSRKKKRKKMVRIGFSCVLFLALSFLEFRNSKDQKNHYRMTHVSVCLTVCRSLFLRSYRTKKVEVWLFWFLYSNKLPNYERLALTNEFWCRVLILGANTKMKSYEQHFLFIFYF